MWYLCYERILRKNKISGFGEVEKQINNNGKAKTNRSNNADVKA
jgi:hypothetical protein